MGRRTRACVLALVGAISVPVVVASLAWACGPSGYGTPDKPPAPPSSTGQPPPATGPSSVSTPAPAQPTSSAGAESGSAMTSGTVGDGPRGRSAPRGRGGPEGRGGGAGASQSVRTTAPSRGQAAFAARVRGATAGFVRQRGQSVFASSTAPRKSAKSAASAASQRRWSGVASAGTNPSLASADAAGAESGGLSGGLIAGSAILGLGLAALTGGALLVTARRPRRAAGIAGARKKQ